MSVNQFLLLAAVLFCIGVYGVIARKNAVLVLMSIELILNAVNLNFIVFGAKFQIAFENFLMQINIVRAGMAEADNIEFRLGQIQYRQGQEH